MITGNVNFNEIGKDFLEHFGVKGMKWGVRRKRTRSGPPSEDAKRHAANRKKDLSELSDKDLRELLNRVNMEQQARRLNPSTVKKGAAILAAGLAVGKTMNDVISFTNSPAGKALIEKLGKKAIKKATGS